MSLCCVVSPYPCPSPYFVAAGGWYYRACGRCTQPVRSTPNGPSCTKHGVRTPQLMLCLTLDLQDATGYMEAVVFGTTAEALTGVSFGNLPITGEKDITHFPDEGRKIIGQQFKIVLGVPQRFIDKGQLSYKVYYFKKISDQDPPTTSQSEKIWIFIITAHEDTKLIH